jgi:hypothetical protein
MTNLHIAHWREKGGKAHVYDNACSRQFGILDQAVLRILIATRCRTARLAHHKDGMVLRGRGSIVIITAIILMIAALIYTCSNRSHEVSPTPPIVQPKK